MAASKALKAGIGYTVGNYLVKGISFLTIPIFARLLSPSDYGIFNTYLAYESILYLFICLAVHTCLKNGKYKYQESFSSFSSSCLLLICINFVIWLLLVNILYPVIKIFTGYSIWIVNILIFHCLASSVLIFYNSYISLNFEYRTYLFVSALNAIGNVVLSVLLIHFVFPSSRYIGRVLGTFIPLAVISIYVFFYFFKKAKPSINRAYWNFALKFSLPLIPHGISQVILSQFDRIMITKMVGETESGIYSFGYTIFSIVQITGTSVDSAWEPWFYKKMHENDYAAIKEKSSIVIVLMALFMAGIMLLSPELLKILGTSAYKDSVYCVISLVAGGFFAFLYNFPAEIEYYFEKTKFIMAGTMAAAILNIVLNYIFIKKFGYIAAAYTTLATYFLYFIFHCFLAKKIFSENVYSKKMLILTSFFIFAATAVSVFFLNIFVVRVSLALLSIGLFILYEEKKIGILRAKLKIKKTVDKCKNE